MRVGTSHLFEHNMQRAQQTCWAYVAGDLGTRPLSFLLIGAQKCNVLTVHTYFDRHRSPVSFVPTQPQPRWHPSQPIQGSKAGEHTHDQHM